MIEPELPISLTYPSAYDANGLITSLELAQEQVIWEQRSQEDGSVLVTILNIINLEEKAEREEDD